MRLLLYFPVEMRTAVFYSDEISSFVAWRLWNLKRLYFIYKLQSSMAKVIFYSLDSARNKFCHL